MIYALEELTKRWGISENDILRMAIKNDIVLSARWRGKMNIHGYIDEEISFFKDSFFFNDLFPIDGHWLKELLTNTLPVLISVIQGDEDDQWHFAMDSPDGSEEGPYTSFDLTRDKIYITSEQIEATEAKYPQLISTVLSKIELLENPEKLEVQCIADSEDAPRKGGAKKHPFQAAIEKAYLYFLKNDKLEFLRSGNRQSFIKEIRYLLKKENTSCQKDEQETINYLAERIKSVKKPSGRWEITTEKYHEEKSKNTETVYKSRTYNISDVSKQLTFLRKKYPFP